MDHGSDLQYVNPHLSSIIKEVTQKAAALLHKGSDLSKEKWNLCNWSFFMDFLESLMIKFWSCLIFTIEPENQQDHHVTLTEQEKNTQRAPFLHNQFNTGERTFFAEKSALCCIQVSVLTHTAKAVLSKQEMPVEVQCCL